MKQTVKKAALSKPPLAKWLCIEAGLLLLLSALLLVTTDQISAYSALLGGLIFIGPHTYFSRWAFRFSGARAARQVAHAFYTGEAGKYLLTVFLFAMVFAFIKPLQSVAIFLAYFFMAVVNGVLAAQWCRRKPADR